MIPDEHFQELDELAQQYWWHRHRVAAVVQAAERFSPRPLPGRYLDVGCGPGASTRRVWDGLLAVGLAPRGAPPPLGVDSDERARRFCEKNAVDFRLLDAFTGLDSLPEGAFGFATALDVVEHLDEPAPMVRALGRRLAKGAVCVLTAPAFPQLTSGWDRDLGHRRRYKLSELRELCRAGGLRVLWSSCLFSYAFIPALAVRRAPTAQPARFPRPGRAAEAALGAISALERAALKLFPLPVGTSAMVVAARPDHP